VYVKWDDGSFQGVSSIDLVKLPKSARLQANPEVSTGALAAGAALIAGAVWLVARKTKASTSDACTVTTAKLFDWSQKQAPQSVLLHLFKLSTPPSLPAIQQSWPQAEDHTKLVVVLEDGSFWSYASGAPVAAPELRKSYCDFVKT
jgi:hypothetical protein